MHLNKTACEIWSVFDKVQFWVKNLVPFFHRSLQLIINCLAKVSLACCLHQCNTISLPLLLPVSRMKETILPGVTLIVSTKLIWCFKLHLNKIKIGTWPWWLHTLHKYYMIFLQNLFLSFVFGFFSRRFLWSWHATSISGIHSGTFYCSSSKLSTK